MIGKASSTHEHLSQIYKNTTAVAASSQTRFCFGPDRDKMQKLIVFVAVVACGLAAPVENNDNSAGARLARPSPINPDIPSDPKPEEKVVLISPEKPLIGENPIIKPLGPYALPSPPKQLSKRQDKDSSASSSSEENSSEEVKKPITILKPVQSTAAPADDATTSTTASYRRPYSPKVHQHNEHLFKPTTEAGSSPSAAIVPAAAVASGDNVNSKRDIPAESQQKAKSDAPKVEVKQEEESNSQSVHPAIITRPIPVAELFAKKPSTAAPAGPAAPAAV